MTRLEYITALAYPILTPASTADVTPEGINLLDLQALVQCVNAARKYVGDNHPAVVRLDEEIQ